MASTAVDTVRRSVTTFILRVLLNCLLILTRCCGPETRIGFCDPKHNRTSRQLR